MVLRHRTSQGCSQIRPQTAGMGLSLRIRRTASAYLPSLTRAIYPGMSTPAGHSATHGTGCVQVKSTSQLNMLFKILPESPEALQHHLGSFITDGTVRGIRILFAGCPLNNRNGLQSGITIQHILK